jgi:hypothetical protein
MRFSKRNLCLHDCFSSSRTCTTPSSRKTRSAISSASHTRDQSRVRLLTIRTERGLDASHQRLRHQQVESNRAESGQTRQGKQCLFPCFFVRDFVQFSASCNTSGCLYCKIVQATGPSSLCASQPKTLGTRRRGRLYSYTRLRLHACTRWKSPSTIANLQFPIGATSNLRSTTTLPQP